jgi:hypothetical protein
MLHTRWSAESGQGRRSSDDATLPGVALFAALYAFFQEHQYCGDLDGGVEGERGLDDVYVWRGDQPECGS